LCFLSSAGHPACPEVFRGAESKELSCTVWQVTFVVGENTNNGGNDIALIESEWLRQSGDWLSGKCIERFANSMHN
jgi:hypothetical protein